MRFIESPTEACIVSCDIVGHGSEPDHQRQRERIRGLNACVRKPIEVHGQERIVWASGGDGGHIAFVGDALLPASIGLLTELAQWSRREKIPLRLTVHRGLVSTFEGADGRQQLVGDGINLCGSLVNFGFPDAIVVTSEFRAFVLNELRKGVELPPIKFLNERTIYLKHFAAQRLAVMGLDGMELKWVIERSDHRKVDEAQKLQNYWQVIYHVKRLLQVDSHDPWVQSALNRLQPRLLTCGKQAGAHPLLASLTQTALAQVISESQLIEREDGDVICESGDSGDTMFIVLRGEVGVVTQRRDQEEQSIQVAALSNIRFTEGEIVGELALGLARKRTATLQSIGPTALLAINYSSYRRLVEGPGGTRLSLSFNTLLTHRVLENMCKTVPYLSLNLTDEDNAKDPRPWERLEDGSELIVLERDKAHKLSPRNMEQLQEPGLYVLAGGQLVEKSESTGARKVISGDNFDILLANLPQAMVNINHEYKIDPEGPGDRVTILKISQQALASYAQGRRYHELAQRVRARMAQQMLFDVFISYAFEDTERAERWRQTFEQAQPSLDVYMSKPRAMHQFQDEINIAIAESRIFVTIVSKNSLRSKWVAEEVRCRKELFEAQHNILSLAMQEGLAEKIASGVSTVTTGDVGSAQEKDAIREAIEIVQMVKARKAPAPLSIRASQSLPE